MRLPRLSLGLGRCISVFSMSVVASNLNMLDLWCIFPWQRFQFSREFFGLLFAEDSCHYLLYSIMFVNSHPVTSIF